VGDIHTPCTPLHLCNRPRRFARGARRSVTRYDAFETRERDIGIGDRSSHDADRSSSHADRSFSHADRSPTQPRARANRSGRSSVHSARRSHRAVAFPAHDDRWATHADPSANGTNASARHAGASDTRWVRSSLHGDRCRTRLCSVGLAARCFVSSRHRFIFEPCCLVHARGCFVHALGCFVQARVRFVSSGDRPRDHGSMLQLLAAPDHSGPSVAFLEAIDRCGTSVDALSYVAAGSPSDRVATTRNSRSFAGLRMTARLVQDDGVSQSG
jgi:hypothetical protein